MVDGNYKRYTPEAQRGIKGEAYFESLIVGHAIPHRIVRQNDLGVDFICEWICGDRPTGLLFAAQVKFSTVDTVTPKSNGQSPLNQLETYTLSGAKKADESTINYWKGLGLPAFLFMVIEDHSTGKSRLTCYYKRYTPLLDGHPNQDDRAGTKTFYRVNDESTFLAYADTTNETWGFARDLVIDYARLSYSKGDIVQLTPQQLGFWPFPNKVNPDVVRYFGEMVGWHQDRIRETCDWTAGILAQLTDGRTID
jgi:hypothetical protein